MCPKSVTSSKKFSKNVDNYDSSRTCGIKYCCIKYSFNYRYFLQFITYTCLLQCSPTKKLAELCIDLKDIRNKEML